MVDTSIAELIEDNLLLIKNAGMSELSIVNDGDKNYHPLDTIKINIQVERKDQQIETSFPMEIIAKDTITVNTYSNAGLPVRILPTNGISIVDNTRFIPEITGMIRLTLEQHGNHNYNAWRKEYELFVINSKGFTVHPNPTNNQINLTTSSSVGTVEKVLIYGLDGKLRRNIRIKEPLSKYALDLSDFEPGIYFLSIKLSNGEIKTIKIVKQ